MRSINPLQNHDFSHSLAQHQAFNALLLLFRHVFTKALGDLSETPRAKRRKSIPTVLSRQEVERLLAALHEPYQ
jgi:hypothetical protein